MRRIGSLAVLLTLSIAACSNALPSPGATSAPGVSGSASPAATTNALIPQLSPDGSIRLLHADGKVTATVPSSRQLQLFSPLGGSFLVGTQKDQRVTSIGALQSDGSVDTLHAVIDPSTFGGAAGAPDGHAFAWIEGPHQSGLCEDGVESGAVYQQSIGSTPRKVAQLPDAGAGAWSIGGYDGSRIWLVRSTGCPTTSSYTTSAYLVAEDGGSLTSVQTQLGDGCTLTGMSLDGSMLCVLQSQDPHAVTWRFAPPGATTLDFTEATLGVPCAGRGALHDFEGFALSLDGRYISVDAGCVGAQRFDQLYFIATTNGAVSTPRNSPYLAADSFLPNDELVCNDLTDPNVAIAYLVTPPGGSAAALGAGQATWSGGGVIW